MPSFLILKEGHLHTVKYRTSFDRINDIRFMGIFSALRHPRRWLFRFSC